MGRKKKVVDDEIVEEAEDSGLIERELRFVSSGSTNLNLALTNTVENGYEDVNKEIKSSDNYDLVIYIMDSLDGLSTEEELEQEFNQKSYNMIKQKKLGELFRRLTQKINKKNMLLVIVSQIRDAIGVPFGETKRRSGGKALDFYAYQIVWLYK